MIGYEASSGASEAHDRDSDDSSSCPSSPRNDHPQRLNSFIGEIPTPAATSRCLGVVVVFNITKRRVRHSYVTSSGVKFLLMDGAGAVLYAGTVSCIIVLSVLQLLLESVTMLEIYKDC